MPAAVLIPLIIAGASAGGQIAAAKIQSNAAKRAGETNAAAANSAADIQSKAEADRLAYEKEQAAIAQKNFEATQFNNYWQARASAQSSYDMDAARQRRLGSLGAMIGEGPRDIPAFNYPDYAGPAPQAAPGSLGSPVASTTGGDPIRDALQKNYAALGVQPTGPGSGPTDIEYFAKRVAQTGGMTPDNVKYWFGPEGRIASELAQARNGGATSQPATRRPAMTLGGMSAPVSMVRTPALQMPGRA